MDLLAGIALLLLVVTSATIVALEAAIGQRPIAVEAQAGRRRTRREPVAPTSSNPATSAGR